MTGLLHSFEYDIFISYRQKDNKGDRWVSEFVESLKTELASTFKEEISIYFDVNPHDGLLETHDVDASLKDKLKCLVFIPVLSRTYCDPNSFAWEHEFKAFIKEASNDQLGLNVKLANGNITSRILPVRIHDLETDDIRLLESHIDLIQPVDFVYCSEGVNRPLRKQDDAAQDQKQLIYRDQINRAALAIKEIILGLKGITDRSFIETNGHQAQPPERKMEEMAANSKKKKLLIRAGVLAILILAVLLAFPGLFRRDILDKLISRDGRIPIAVMPFQNLTNDTLWDIWQDGIQIILITSLSNSKELKVRQVGTINSILKSKGFTDYAALAPSVAGWISKKLETNVNITGSIKQSGSRIRLNAQLVRTKTGETFKSFQIDGTADNILPFIDSLSRMVQDFLLISVLQKEVPNFEHYPPLLTKSPDAYKYIILGIKAFDKYDFSTAIDMYMQAIKLDSTNLYDLYGSITAAYMNLGLFGQAKDWCLKAYSKLDMMDMQNKLAINYLYASLFETPNEATRYLKQMIDLDDQEPLSHYMLGDLYRQMHQSYKAIPEFEKSLEIYKKWDSKPPWVANYQDLGDVYHWTGQYKKEKKLYLKAERDFPGNVFLIYNQAILAVTEKDTIAANRYIKKYISIARDSSWSEAIIAGGLAGIYSQAGFPDKVEEYRRKALSLDQENWRSMNNLAAFLIDNDRNINEGLELIERALKLSPNTYTLYHWKGWGFYKQGKYKEALKLLEKADSLHFHVYVYGLNSHLEAAKKAVAELR